MVKTALCIGINYVRTEFELRGCVNDANDWSKLLGSHGFNCTKLIEASATRDNILHATKGLISVMRDGDVAFVTYSGHGTWLPDGDEPDSRNEAICPIDMGTNGEKLVLGSEFHTLFNDIPKGAHLVFITDSCHSGHVYRLANPLEGKTAYRRARFIPPIRLVRSDMVAKVDRAFGQVSKTADAPLPGLIHFSGCNDAELSNDTEIDGRPCGAFSYFALRAFGRAASLGQTYADAYKGLRQSLPSMEFTQTPLLNALKPLKSLKVFG